VLRWSLILGHRWCLVGRTCAANLVAHTLNLWLPGAVRVAALHHASSGEITMLPDDPIVRGRLFHAARALLCWTQARVAESAGISSASVHAIELGRAGSRAGSVLAVCAALERAGVRFLAAAGGEGQGVRYALTGGRTEIVQPITLHLVPPAARKLDTRDDGPEGRIEGSRLDAARSRTARQRQLVQRLSHAGHDTATAKQLLEELERALTLLSWSVDLGTMSNHAGSGATSKARASAA
jgi:DNA-binding XRE family transcriptional regulator